jgi:hypothetical protein
MNQESIMVCTYGPSGIGKTTDQGYSFPSALFVAAPGALQSIRTTCGYEPASTNNVTTLSEATALLQQVAGDFSAVVIDDFSFMAEQTFSSLEKKYSGFKLWGKLRDVALEFRNTARYCGVDVILNCWEQPPKTKPDGSAVLSRFRPCVTSCFVRPMTASAVRGLQATLAPHTLPSS